MRLMYAVIATIEVDKEHARKMANKSSITITELADTLARDYGISFRKAHSIASRISKETAKLGKELYDWDIADINRMIAETVEVSLTKEEWEKIISPEYFVDIRSIQGGPSPKEVARMIAEREQRLAAQMQEHQATVEKLEQKRKELLEFSF